MELIKKTAREIVAGLQAGDLTPGDCLDALETRIGEVDGQINALPTLCLNRARDRAGAASGTLAGLPVAIKDLSAVEGVRTTYGSPIYADHIPAASDHVVEKIEANGGLIYAKSNTPEFGAGASTFNEVFGRTRNPWNLSRSVAGSSGGSAAALVSGTAWLAHGSDMGGSLRNPASFCGCVGLRPSGGRVPMGPSANEFDVLGQQGPMARNVGDLGLFLDAMSGPDPREPFAQPDGAFRAAAEAPRVPLRVAYSPDFGGLTPVDPEVRRLTEAAAQRFEALGATVEEASPDYSGAHDAFQVLRALAFATAHDGHIRNHRDKLKPDVIWNIEKAYDLTGADVVRANAIRHRMTQSHAAFFQTYDLLLAPATIVSPYPVEDRTVTECDGHVFDTYIDWLAIAYAVTLTSAPAMSLPCGFTATGLPVGVQMIGALRGEADLLSYAAALEADLALDLGPIDPREGV